MQLESSLLLSLSMIAPALAADPIPVYVLAGQSNMEGKARVEVMERQLLEEATAARYAHLRDGDEWLVRDDVSCLSLSHYPLPRLRHLPRRSLSLHVHKY